MKIIKSNQAIFVSAFTLFIFASTECFSQNNIFISNHVFNGSSGPKKLSKTKSSMGMTPFQFSYQKKFKPTELRMYQPGYDTTISKYEYDSSGKLLKETMMMFWGISGEWEIAERNTYTYDKNGFLIEDYDEWRPVTELIPCYKGIYQNDSTGKPLTSIILSYKANAMDSFYHVGLKNIFKYDPKGNLIERTSQQANDTSDTSSYQNHQQYEFVYDSLNNLSQVYVSEWVDSLDSWYHSSKYIIYYDTQNCPLTAYYFDFLKNDLIWVLEESYQFVNSYNSTGNLTDVTIKLMYSQNPGFWFIDREYIFSYGEAIVEKSIPQFIHNLRNINRHANDLSLYDLLGRKIFKTAVLTKSIDFQTKNGSAVMGNSLYLVKGKNAQKNTGNSNKTAQ
jgi:hypothetical protein